MTQTTKQLLFSLIAVGLIGEMAMAKSIEKEEIITTVGHYQKPGAPIDITHNVARLEKGEVSDINATLTTTVHSGEMEVTVTLDEGLVSDGGITDITRFVLADDRSEYTMNFKVSAQKDGLYYIRLLAKIDDGTGAKMRAMAIPVYVGEGRLKKKSNQVIMKAMSGENLSISKAQETIEVIE